MGFINTDKKRTNPRVFLDREDILLKLPTPIRCAKP